MSDSDGIGRSMLHGSGTWPVREENKAALQRTELTMVRSMEFITLISIIFVTAFIYDLN